MGRGGYEIPQEAYSRAWYPTKPGSIYLVGRGEEDLGEYLDGA